MPLFISNLSLTTKVALEANTNTIQIPIQIYLENYGTSLWWRKSSVDKLICIYVCVCIMSLCVLYIMYIAR